MGNILEHKLIEQYTDAGKKEIVERAEGVATLFLTMGQDRSFFKIFLIN